MDESIGSVWVCKKLTAKAVRLAAASTICFIHRFWARGQFYSYDI